MIHFHWHKQKTFNNALKALILISGLFMFAYAMLTPVFAIFVERIGGGVSEASIAYAIFWAVAGILTFITGKLEEKMKETELAIVWSQYIVGLSYIILYFTNTIGFLYFSMFILGIGNAVFWPAFHSVYGSHTQKKHATSQWSFYDALAYLIPAFGAALGGFLVNRFGFQTIFIIMAIITFVNGTFILLLPRRAL